MTGIDDASLHERARRAAEGLDEANRALESASAMLRDGFAASAEVEAVAREIDRASTRLEASRQELLRIRKAAEVIERVLSDRRP